MKNVMKSNAIKGAVLVALALTACKQAGYQVLRPGAGGPQNFEGTSTNAPTARIEAIENGSSITWTYVDSKIEIRPSLDTLDADYISKSTCSNPGIIHAGYDLGNGSKPVVDRTNCDSLSVKDVTFSKAGDYLVQMEVKSQDNEIAWATMTLRVVEKGTPRDQIEGGFTVFAKPILVKLGQGIDFTGICELKGQLTISWDFADSKSGEGAVVNHVFDKAGSYRVSAVCKSSSGKSFQASLTVVVITTDVPKLPDVSIPTPSINPNIPNTTGCDPTQGPCQTGTTQMPSGGKTVPTPTTVYYYPSCNCYTDQYYYYY